MQFVWLTIVMLVNNLTRENIKLKSELEQTRLALQVSDAHRLTLQEQLTIAHMKSMQH
jgi:hypothetical protein